VEVQEISYCTGMEGRLRKIKIKIKIKIKRKRKRREELLLLAG
jgi:hypothetical protein